jgi:hypothetical protein
MCAMHELSLPTDGELYAESRWIMRKRPSINDFLSNLDQPMPLPEKLAKLTRNLWRRVVLRQTCCGHHGEPGCWKVEDASGSDANTHSDHHH